MAKVLIGCKLPSGIILELIEQAPQKNGIIPAPTGQRVKLNGANSVRIQSISVNPADHGYGVTSVDEDFWDKWMKASGNKDLAFIKNGQVFKVATRDAFDAESMDRSSDKRTRSNLEPLDMSEGTKDPRVTPGVKANEDTVAAALVNQKGGKIEAA